MNDLYLIGNGFDLAHGLKTSYNDFLLWYLNDFLNKLWTKDHFEDDILRIDRTGVRYQVPSDFNSVSDILKWLKEHDYVKKSHSFFKDIVDNHTENRWVDIEYDYYLALVEIFKRFEKTGLSRDINTDKELTNLNKCFDSIKKKLVEYLSSIQKSEQHEHKLIGNILTQGTDIYGKDEGDKLFLYFNYTSTLELYTKQFYFPKHELIYIHGKLTDENNPIIFGYGDEMDPHYEKVENLNNNEFLRNIKSFGYFRTSNYQRVNSFINGRVKNSQSKYWVIHVDCPIEYF